MTPSKSHMKAHISYTRAHQLDWAEVILQFSLPPENKSKANLFLSSLFYQNGHMERKVSFQGLHDQSFQWSMDFHWHLSCQSPLAWAFPFPLCYYFCFPRQLISFKKPWSAKAILSDLERSGLIQTPLGATSLWFGLQSWSTSLICTILTISSISITSLQLPAELHLFILFFILHFSRHCADSLAAHTSWTDKVLWSYLLT